MECAVCEQSVSDFKLVMKAGKNDARSAAQELVNFTSSNGLEEDGAVDVGDKFSLRRSFSSSGSPNANENTVLRIDNTPWDITPLQIKKWLQQPVEKVHVLLDSKGKTMSHAYIEVGENATADAILSGEAASSAGTKERGNILGRGKRARGVTITRSGQGELMHDLFPNWHGSFSGTQSSLIDVDEDTNTGVLGVGLLSENEISELLYLIKAPDSHFLKITSLPFYSLISILSKLPTVEDSSVFLSPNIRDRLLDATLEAIKILMPRIAKVKEGSSSFRYSEGEEYSIDLANELLNTALNCKAFTVQQKPQLESLAQTFSLTLPEH